MGSEVDQLLFRAESLWDQFKREGGRHLIDGAIAFAREALELCPPSHPSRAPPLNWLSVYLSDRYQQFGDIRDIEEGIAVDVDALRICPPPEHPDCHVFLGNLAKGLSTRYNQLGAIDDLDKAILVERGILALLPPGHQSRSISLNNFGDYLRTRYEKLGAMEDLDESISSCRDSLALCRQGLGKLDRSLPLNNLAIVLHHRYDKLGAVGDLDEAIASDQEALSLRPLGHPLRSSSLNNLSIRFHVRYIKLGKIDDLDAAIVLKQQAVALRPPGHPLRSSSLTGLSSELYERYKKLGKKDDLDDAIVLNKEALQLCPLGHPLRSLALQNLAVDLLARFTHFHQSHDKEELFGVHARLVDISHTATSSDLSAAKRWIIVAEKFKHSTTVLAYETYFRLLIHHLTALPSLSRNLNIVKEFASLFAQDAFSAALRNLSPTKAVELLEQGRGVFLSQLGRLRSPVDDVIASGPDGKTLGDKFLQLTSDIQKSLALSGANQHHHVCHLNIELQTVVSNIRKLPGFSHFLLPLPFLHLQNAATDGPVIIVNASKYGCDALIVLFDRDPVHIPLQITRDEVQDMALDLHRLTEQTETQHTGKYLAVMMRELWETVVSPIVDVLRKNHTVQSRIWWCPTAEFSVLPLHAAGMYRGGEPKLSDFYISSYTSSLAALIHARDLQLLECRAEGKRFVAVGQANVVGEDELLSVADELTAVGERVDGLAVFTCMEGSKSCITPVLEALGQNEWVHFACHGLANQKQPFESAFCLYDGQLTVERILHCDLRNAEFAYLSACHTTVGDEDGLDEMIHLASAMQFAGFRSVIGTMWAVDDEQTVKITSKFYEKMVDESGRLDHTRAAYALHHSMKELQGLSFDQRILYVHFGA